MAVLVAPLLRPSSLRPLSPLIVQSKYNGVDPTQTIADHGADAARLFVLFKVHTSCLCCFVLFCVVCIVQTG